jgi:hypothetical protein
MKKLLLVSMLVFVFNLSAQENNQPEGQVDPNVSTGGVICNNEENNKTSDNTTVPANTNGSGAVIDAVVPTDDPK